MHVNKYQIINKILPLMTVFFLSLSCNDEFLDEYPIDSVSLDVLFSSKTGFEQYSVSLYEAARQEHNRKNSTEWQTAMWTGTDVAIAGSSFESQWEDYLTYLTPTRSVVNEFWSWAYRSLLIRANTIISYAEKLDNDLIWNSEEEKNRYIAEAKFFRAYGHNVLVNLYGDIPIQDTLYTVPKADFIRSSRKNVLEFIRRDLEYASEWLPVTVDSENEGRIVKAAADHLLTEVYISLDRYDDAIQRASQIINSGIYQLMTERFGIEKDLPGDVFSDLFVEGNQNRSSGNLESIYVWQFADNVPGGGNNMMQRFWGPFYIHLKDPDGDSGMILADSLGRGVAWCRPTNYVLYDVWKDHENDIRNSEFNIKRNFYYNNPESKYFGQLVEEKNNDVDTLQNIYPQIQKIVGATRSTSTQPDGQSAKDIIVYRLAETYLLRAEAFLLNGDNDKAASDLNVIRERAGAPLILPEDVTVDFILDERVRELVTEEPRRRTLVRMGKLVEYVKRYSDFSLTKISIKDYHGLWPIPQYEIDANFGAELVQNPGY